MVYKIQKSINCKHPKGFSQRQHCRYGRKNMTLKKYVRKTRKTQKNKRIKLA